MVFMFLRPVVSASCLLFANLLVFCLVNSENSFCPPKCTCSKQKQSPYSNRLKIKCGDEGLVSTIDELHLDNLENVTELIILDLSGNNLTYLHPKAFPTLEVQKLELNNNYIETIDDGAFENLISLKRLDLSNNRIKLITSSMFVGLTNLEKLKLSQNSIRQIKFGSFENLISLKQLDLSGNPLLCDCELWFWAKNITFKLTPMPKCLEPVEFQDLPLKKLMISSNCSGSASPLELYPDHDQVVFEGDSLRLDCRAGLIVTNWKDISVTWYWADIPPKSIFHSSVHIENKHIAEGGLFESSLLIDQLTANHTGEWNCKLVSSEGNHSSTVSVIVISGSTKYCKSTVSKSNKGEYIWPKTVAGHVVELPCAAGIGIGMARNNCSITGDWTSFNTSECAYLSETTRILQQYAKMNLSAGHGSILESAVRLHNYTLERKFLMKDPIDIVFLSQTITNYLQFVDTEGLGTLLLDLISNIMDLDKQLLSDAQMKDRSCSKLLFSIEKITQHHFSSSVQNQKWNMAIEKFSVTRESFLGMTCTWWNSREGKHGARLFRCSTSNTSTALITDDKVLEASIQIPSSLFHQLDMRGNPASTHQIMVSIFDNSKLFPTPFNLNRTVLSPVVGVKLVGIDVRDLVEPAYVMLGGLREGIFPAWWDDSLGDWVVPPCRSSHLLQDHLVTKCHHLGYFSLISDIRIDPPSITQQAKSRMSSPATFIGTFVGSTCLLVAAFTYAVCRTSIQMSDKMKHALANTWVAISSLAIFFNIGMYQTENLKVCQGIGLLLHYLTLCTLFWMAVSINCMHRAFSRLETVVTRDSDDGSGQPEVMHQPLVGIYLFGWGVSALLVGLSGAVNPRGYASPTYCSLGPGPGFTPVLVPVSALFVFILTRVLMVRSAAVEKDSNAQLSEGTQATDLEMLETGLPTSDRTSIHSIATPSSHVEDLEHPPYVQLKAFVIIIALFTLTWTAGALSVICPFHLSHEETIFSIIYSVFMILLGSFVIFFYCFSRSDVRSVWFTLRHIKRSRNVTDFTPPLIMNSNDTSTSAGRKSISPRPEPQGEVMQKPNFVDLHRRQYHNNTVSEPNAFYNPHQSIVARKFFKKQRRKRNSLGHRRGVGDGTPVSPDNSELFHLGCKSTVGSSTPHSEPRNPLLCDRRPLERLVIGAESSRPNTISVNNVDGSVKYASVASDCCSCLVSEAHSVTDCTRDLTSEHSSRSSHLYATVAPDMSPAPAHRDIAPKLIAEMKNEGVRLNMLENAYDLKSSSDDDKRETSV